MSIAISIVEDDPKVRSILARLVDGKSGICCVSQHGNAEEALEEIPKLQPDVVLMDINLPGINGVECVCRLKPQLPGTQIVMLTVYQNTEHIFNALAAGATGYMLKSAQPEELLAAIKEANAGGSPIDGFIARKIVHLFQQPMPTEALEVASLSLREVEVLDYLAHGFRYKEIAEKMGISYDTVHTHTRHIYKKLHVRSRTAAVVKHLAGINPIARWLNPQTLRPVGLFLRNTFLLLFFMASLELVTGGGWLNHYSR